MNFPNHELAQYTRADQLGHDINGFYLMSSDDSAEQESFESIFGAELPFVKSDYPSLFIFQNEDMTVVYGCSRVCVMNDSPVDLIYFWSIDTMQDGAYSPYAGMSLESGQVWGSEDKPTTEDKPLHTFGFIPFSDPSLKSSGESFVGLAEDNRLVYKRITHGKTVWTHFYTLDVLRTNIRHHMAMPMVKNVPLDLTAWIRLYNIACQWGVK